MRLSAAIAVGKAAASLSRRLGLGGGTTLPGELARRIEPRFLAKLTARLPGGTVLVTGTNGKTTTARMLSAVLRQAGQRPVHNRAGANLLNGMASALAQATSLGGHPDGDVGLFEVDEATLPLAAAETQPRVVVITNLFRDQLDRYGEVDHVAARWREALCRLPASCTAVLNADDPLVAGAGRDLAARVLFYGVEDAQVGTQGPQRNADARTCPVCGAGYRYRLTYYAHVGWYECPRCGLTRPAADVSAAKITLHGTAGTTLRLSTPQGEGELHLRLPGLYNVYNALAAIGAGLALDLSLETILAGLRNFAAAFGRVERVTAEGRDLYLALVKNPVGFDQVLATVLADGQPVRLLIMINDNLADGTDISWLWDVDFEALPGRAESVVAAGTRAEDLAVRLKYAGLDEKRLQVESDPARALSLALDQTPAGQTLYLLPTYTAMLEVRAEMGRRGYVGQFWED